MEISSAPTLPSLLLETYHELHPDRPPPDLFNKQSTEYLTRLTGYSLNSLTSEPSRIADEHDFVGRELTSLCIGEYKSFVAVHQCEEQVRGVLDDFDASLEELRKAIPELERQCATFVQETSGIQSERRRAQIVLEHQDKLVDLLDIPQLVDTCVRNGYYHEAMELTAHTRQLVSRHPDVALVHSISAQVTSIMQLQLSQLVASLREPVKLPVLVKSIGFLRKMGSLEEDELRLAFLESRAQCWRDYVKEHVDKERHEPTRYVRRYVDAFRELQYDTVSQYTAIFLDPSTFRTHNHTSNGNTAALDAASRAQAVDLLVRYAHQAIADLLQCITTHVPSITDPSSLASLLTQLGYTALSFARVGMDFSAYLPEVFENAIQELTTRGWHNALTSVLDKLKAPSSNTRAGSPSGRLDIDSVLLPGFLVSSEMLASMTRSGTQAYTPPVHGPSSSKTVPPLYLTSYPLLATYTNSTLVTFNALRLLAPVALFPQLYANLLDNLAELAQALLAYANTVTGQGDTASLPPARRRPEGLRRNTSISNRDQLAERTQAQERDGRRVLSTVLDAYVNGCIVFLKAALVEGVYHGRFGSVKNIDGGKEITETLGQSNQKLAETIEESKRWIEKHAELPVEQEKVTQPGIAEEETGTEIAPSTNDFKNGTEVDHVRPEDVKEALNNSEGHVDPPTEPGQTSPSSMENEAGPGYDLEVNHRTLPETVETAVALEAVDAGFPRVEVVENPGLVDAGAESIEHSNDASGVHESISTEPKTHTAVAGPHDESPSMERNVIEQVLEIAVEVPESAEVDRRVVENAKGVPVQVTEELQIPSVSADSLNMDDAKPVPIVPDASIHDDSAGHPKASVNGLGDGEDAPDMLDELIKAKQAAEAAVSEKDRNEHHPDISVARTDAGDTTEAVLDEEPPALANTPSSRLSTSDPVTTLDKTAPTEVLPPGDGSEPKPQSASSQDVTLPLHDQDQTSVLLELSNGSADHTAFAESPAVTADSQETKPQQIEQQDLSIPVMLVEPAVSKTPPTASSEEPTIVQSEPPIPAEAIGAVSESPTPQTEEGENDAGEGDDSSPPTPREPAPPEDGGRSEPATLESVANGKSKKKKNNKKKGKK
ncbi:hypothetical protein QFC22_001466 [Naganishia vaughanmartiniae]|uniref:Uncharacterized protein n=1 Tax=Naganishia vaughanmartiniae TaxID=1424756 RepID=A0ACC2XHG6_9TREE|nr:hypothetical protein QFC22_001466 [Naganishia vaughanmartiniae]